MSKKFVAATIKYISQIISGFESGLYKMLKQNNNARLNLLSSKHHPFITIFRDLHESYYTSTYNSILARDDEYVVKTFDNFQELSGHSKQCLLNILANLTVSIHFNLNRQNLNYSTYDLYMASLNKEINSIMDAIDMHKLFDHVCTGPSDNQLKPLEAGSKFINISLKMKSNGVEKEIHSFTENESDDSENNEQNNSVGNSNSENNN